MAQQKGGNPLFVYQAIDAKGKKKRGKVYAANESAALASIEANGLFPVSIRDNESLGLFERELQIGRGKNPNLRDLSIATRQLAVLIDSGISLLRSLEIVAQQSENKMLEEALEAARRDVGQGISLSEALERRPKIFPAIMINLTRVGESGGFLSEALESAATNFDSELRLQQKVKAAMSYPIVVLIVALLAVAAMLLFVVPVFEDLFSGFGSELPLPTLILVGLSRSAIYWIPALFLIIGVATYWYSKHKGDDNVRRVVDTIKLKMPIFGSLLQKVAIARVTRNLAMMLKAGVPALQALELVGKVSNNWVIEEALRAAENSMRHGRNLSDPLAHHEAFPPMVTQMVAVGEESGSLATMLDTVAKFYDREVETTSEQLTSLIEPLLIVFVGVVIGGMMIALYLPVFTMSSTIQGM